MSGITTKDLLFFNKAVKVAELSDYRPYRLGAVAVYGKHIIALGINSSYKTHPLQKEWNKERNFNNTSEYAPSLVHAEINCLSQIKKEVDFSRIHLYIARVRKDGTTGLARPCPACMGYIKSLGIKRVFYTSDIGFVEERIL